MKYLEITILSLFIGFLIIFFLSNSVYNKCISEKTKESFIDAQERASLLALKEARAAEKSASDSKLSMVAQYQQQQKLARRAGVRSRQRAGNKLVATKWDNTRNSQFGKFNSYANNISKGTSKLDNYVNKTTTLYKQNYMLPPKNNEVFSNTIPVQLNKLKAQFGQLYTDSKAQDDKLTNVASRITSVNNLLSM
jgi:hypothetical protein